MSENSSRWDEIRKIHRESGIGYRILGGLVLVGLLILFGQENASDRNDFDLNLFTEIIGVAITVLIVDTIYSYRDKKRRSHELKERLLHDARSPEQGTARNAFHRMKEQGLIYGEDSILRGALLLNSSPAKVDLSSARLDGVYLLNSNFNESFFFQANLENSHLNNAKLRRAFFREASMRNADLEGADLTQADLVSADLTGANLKNANLESARLFIEYLFVPEETQDDPNAYKQLILPDGTTVTGDIDMSRFTNPHHDEFWRSTSPQSPACVDHQKRFEYVVSSLLKEQD